MAALGGAEIDDLIVTLDGPEPPILDGDAARLSPPYRRGGHSERSAPRPAIKILKPVTVIHKDALVTLAPGAQLEYQLEIAFDAAAIGAQTCSLSPFRRKASAARSHRRAPSGSSGNSKASMRPNLARGAGLEEHARHRWTTAWSTRRSDALSRRIRPPQDSRRDRRHGACGAPLVARIEGVRSGHALNNGALRALFADTSNYAKIALS